MAAAQTATTIIRGYKEESELAIDMHEPQVNTPEEFAEGGQARHRRLGKLVNALGIPPQ